MVQIRSARTPGPECWLSVVLNTNIFWRININTVFQIGWFPFSFDSLVCTSHNLSCTSIWLLRLYLAQLHDIFCEVARVIEVNSNIELNSFYFRLNLQFGVRVQMYTLLWGYRKRLWVLFGILRVGRGRFSIRIAPAKSTRFLLVLVNSATVVEKSWIICRRISWFLQISLRGSYAVSVRKSDSFLCR